MKNSIPKQPAEAAGLFELGGVLGQRKAFGTIAGRCSAAEAAAIRRLREERLFRASNLSWKEFCPRYLGMCRAQADRLIQRLEEFGPDFFELTQLTRIPAEDYRAIAPAVKDGHIHWKNEAIALLPENTEKVTAAVISLRDAARAEAPPVRPEPPATSANTRASVMEALKQRADQLVAEWASLVAVRYTFPLAERQTMMNLIARTRVDLQRLEQQVWNQGR